MIDTHYMLVEEGFPLSDIESCPHVSIETHDQQVTLAGAGSLRTERNVPGRYRTGGGGAQSLPSEGTVRNRTGETRRLIGEPIDHQRGQLGDEEAKKERVDRNTKEQPSLRVGSG